MNRENVGQEVMRLADAWATAELRGDTTFLESTLADDFIGIGPLGFMLTKQEWLARHQSGDLKYESFNLDEVKMRVYNDAAVLTGRQAQSAAYRGNSIKAQLRTTLVFVQQQGQWQLASLQLSTIGQARISLSLSLRSCGSAHIADQRTQCVDRNREEKTQYTTR